MSGSFISIPLYGLSELHSYDYWQPGDLEVLRGVVRGFSEEARTRGSASLTLVRFAFVAEVIVRQ